MRLAKSQRTAWSPPQSLGADAVVAMRFASDSIAEGTIEILAYGTAVKFA